MRPRKVWILDDDALMMVPSHCSISLQKEQSETHVSQKAPLPRAIVDYKDLAVAWVH